MRRLILLFILMSFLGCSAQQKAPLPKYIVACGEYQCFLLPTATGRLYGISSNLRLLATGSNGGNPGRPSLVDIPDDLTITAVASGLHNSAAVDNKGNVWTWGSNENAQSGNGTTENAPDNYPHKITEDSLGNSFTDVVQVTCWNNGSAEGCLAVKKDGTVWIWGKTGGGFRGNGQYGSLNKRPVSIDIPGHKKIVKVVAAEIILALASDGSVWTWGGDNRPFLSGTTGTDYRRPSRVNLPQAAKDIAGASYVSYALGINGKLYGWGYAGAYLGIGNGGYAANTPVALPRDLTADLALPHPVMAIVTNSVCTHVILTDSTLWGWGDNATGCIGNGEELNYAEHAPPYAWDFGPAELLVQKPVRLAPNVHNFTHVFGGSAYVFYTYAETATGQLYSWGRNKGGVLGNGVVGASPEIMSIYPNSWDVPVVTEVDPFALTDIVISTSPYCLLHPDGSPCNDFTIPSNKTPVADAGKDLEVSAGKDVLLDGSASKDEDGKILYYKWGKISGSANCRIINPSSSKTTLIGLRPGVYIFVLKVTDNGWATDSAKVKITVK
jgi:alpha-tubulin suppressor-like RCC1 family protein